MDHFVTTPPIATFSLGFVISQFESVNGTLKDEENLKDFQEAESASDALCVRISSRREFAESLEGTYDKVFRIQQILKRYLASGFPACELKVVALPNVALIRPADSLGLIVMRYLPMIWIWKQFSDHFRVISERATCKLRVITLWPKKSPFNGSATLSRRNGGQIRI